MGHHGNEVGIMSRSVIEASITAETNGVSHIKRLWSVARFLALGTLLAVLSAGTLGATGLYEQVFVLHPGWNAIYLEVEPETDDLASAFAGVPVGSVWTWMPDDGTVEFIQDPAEGLVNDSGWLGYFPRPRPEAFLTNLFFLQANRAYLVKLEGTQPVTWRVSGTPSLRPQQWIADSYNLTGLPVDPNRLPTFGAYFADRQAHEDQAIYRLDPNGTWTPVLNPYSTAIQSGEAYWIYCKGNSDFDGPLSVGVEYGDALDFGASLNDQVLIVQNLAAADTDITIRRLNSSTPVPLSLIITDEVTGQETWASVPTEYSMPVFAGQQLLLHFGVRRAELGADVADQVVEVSNGFGARRLVNIVAKKVFPAEPPAKSGKTRGFFKAVGTPFAGLWQGQVLVNAVSEAQMGGTSPMPAGKEFPLRYIIHVDGAGSVKLLKDVIEMWEEGTQVPDTEEPDFLVVDTPGRPVLLTNEDLIPSFTGVTMRDGIPVGIRLSTVAYDFAEEYLDMNGSVGLTGSLDVVITMEANFPTNPFLSRYHPDHNNLDEQYLNFKPEAYEVTRRILFVFSETDPTEENPPDWGDSTLGGTYFEEITGVHRNTIYVGGTFRLQRVSGVTELNR